MARRKKKKSSPVLILFILLIAAGYYYYNNIYNKKEISKTEKPKKETVTRYNRDDWGDWADEDNDGLNTRHEVLARESLVKPIISNNRVISGKWYDKFTGKYFTNARDLDIDHLVPLKNAHISGASNWSKEKKNEYYNYMKNENHLVAVSKGANRSKGDKSPVEWLPPNEEYQCEYVREWYKIKTDWGLTIEEGFDEVSNRVCKGK
ncbi:HNH endonuclease [Brachyspira hyodysenteriae]|uniref:HNH endonuclease family protein n=1 Tax=Brachyspira hyodysenteriae TaxID=159 RepID=UPI001ADD673E|nr:HNH endonuclease family protein [Brachyspira hyodysenteriae]MBT8718705.1 HNH endonuclease [Brachyspira hyodysenteriae]MBT8729112.1 HNH endonuclease [Brachyspira hyodysenteriae]MBT8731529.1 HNH endonuclease [Brachyspira hyodysenteriae]MBT8734111.1 HNH endonuclease [Brachyspira hyodysenteriae]MBT8736856.1 HNH endonuclease [Brachyspira hyodysenteriae]